MSTRLKITVFLTTLVALTAVRPASAASWSAAIPVGGVVYAQTAQEPAATDPREQQGPTPQSAPANEPALGLDPEPTPPAATLTDDNEPLTSRSSREGNTVLHKVPYNAEFVESRPANLARVYLGAGVAAYRGSTLQEKETAGAQVLITDDDALDQAVTPGHITYVVELPESLPVDTLMFVPYTGSGQASVSVSEVALEPQSASWFRPMDSIAYKTGEVAVLRFPYVNAKYVKLDLQVASDTKLGNFGIFGTRTIEDFDVNNRHSPNAGTDIEPTVDEIVAGLSSSNTLAHARILYVSSNASDRKLEEAYYMIDDDPETFYEFAADDKNPTVVVEFDAPRRVRRLSTFTKGPSDDMEFYDVRSLDALTGRDTGETATAAAPAPRMDALTADGPLRQRVMMALMGQSQGSAPETLSLPNAFFADRTPLAAIPLGQSTINGGANTSTEQTRLIIFRLNPEGGSASRVHEVSAFGNPFDEVYDAAPAQDPIDANVGGGGFNPNAPPPVPNVNVVSP